MSETVNAMMSEITNVSFYWSSSITPSGNAYTLHLRDPMSYVEIFSSQHI